MPARIFHPPTSPEHHAAAIVQLQSCTEEHIARLASLEEKLGPMRELSERVTELRTAQGYIKEDFQDALKELAEEMRYMRRTAFSLLATLLSGIALAGLGTVLATLAK